jgi:hypothetical protein
MKREAKRVVLARPSALDFTKRPDEQRAAIRKFVRRFVRALRANP